MEILLSQEIVVDKLSVKPVYQQICESLTGRIRLGLLPAGVAVTPSRQLAQTLGVHRKTVVSAYEQLVLQGWLVSQPRRGYFVASSQPITNATTLSDFASRSHGGYPQHPAFDIHHTLKAQLIRAEKGPEINYSFDDGFPDVRLAPIKELLIEYQAIAKRKLSKKILSYSAKEGCLNLRRELAKLLRQTRGMDIQAENILVTKGAQMGIYLISSLLLAPGDHVIVSSPGYFVVNLMLERLGANVHHVPVDESGVNVDLVASICQRHSVRMIYIIPHHHHPTTATLIAERRVALLKLAEQHRIAIIEDDFDFDIHFGQMPTMPIASIDRSGNVVYIGTLTKVIAPAIRIGYLVAPKHLISLLGQHRYLIDLQGDNLLEEATAQLLKNGTIERHLSKVRLEYRQRRDLLCKILSEELAGIAQFEQPSGGMCLWVRFDGVDVRAICEHARQDGLFIQDASRHFYGGQSGNALCLGYASLDCQELIAAARILVNAVYKAIG